MWASMFDLSVSVGEKVLRAAIIYIVLLGAMRLRGKRELGQQNTLDLLVLILVANAVQNGIIGNDNSVTGAVIGAATLFGMNSVLARLAYRYAWADWLVEGNPVVLMRDGKPLVDSLRSQGIALGELAAAARRQGFEDLSKVGFAILETNGTISMFRRDDPDLERVRRGLSPGRRRRRERASPASA